jgi:hypothetical protein
MNRSSEAKDELIKAVSVGIVQLYKEIRERNMTTHPEEAEQVPSLSLSLSFSFSKSL